MNHVAETNNPGGWQTTLARVAYVFGVGGRAALVAIPAAALALFALGFLMYEKTWGLDVVTTAERGGGFLASAYDTDGDELTLSGFNTDKHRYSTLALDGLSEEQRNQTVDGVIAIPMILEGDGFASDGEISMQAGDERIDPIDCPSGVPQFPSDISSELQGGFLCFDESAAGETLIGFHIIFRGSDGDVGDATELNYEYLGGS